MVGRYSSVLEDTGSNAIVTRLTSESEEPITVPVVAAAVAYDFEYTGKTFILVIYNALYFPNMNTNLVPPIMICISGLNVGECPNLFSKKPTESNHSVYFPTL